MYICKLLQTNIKSESLFKIWLCKLCKRLHLANYDIGLTISPLPIRNTGYAEVPLRVTAKNMKLYTFLNFTSIAAAEERPLSHKTPQSFHRPRYCGVQTFPLKMHYRGEKLGKNWGRSGRILIPNERVLTVGVPVYGVKFNQNWVRIATVGEVTDRQTDRQKDTQTGVIL